MQVCISSPAYLTQAAGGGGGLLVLDDFSRATSGNLSANPTPAPTNTPGNDWTNTFNVTFTAGNKLNIAGGGSRAWLDVEDETVKVSFVMATDAAQEVHLGARFATGDRQDGYTYFCRGGFTRLYRWTTGSATQLVQEDGGAYPAGGKFTISVTGTGSTVTIKGYKDDVEVVTFDDTDASRKTSGNFVGFHSDTGGGDMDDFRVEAI